MRNRRGAIDGILLVVFFLALTALTLWAFLSHEWRPRVASEHGRAIDGMITYLLIASGLIFVIGHLVLIGLLWSKPAAGSYIPPKQRTEWLWVMIPVFTMTLISEGGVLVIGLPVWSQVYETPPKDALVVEAVGKQFEWLFRYPGPDKKFGRTDPKFVDAHKNPFGLDPSDKDAQDDIVVRTLNLPVGQHVVVKLRSHDVVHSFSIPEFRVKQDVIPGFTATTQFTPTDVGEFEVACVELCGLGHFTMRAVVKVKSQKDFQKWLDKQVGQFE